jgi:Delta14-sterol reductase
MDITTDGLGFMLIVGLLTWLPFVYSLQARYLVFKQLELGPKMTVFIIFVNLLGYYIFRAANGEKDRFRKGRNPHSKYSSRPVLWFLAELLFVKT